MKIGDIFECADGVFPKEALDLCVDGVSIQEVEPTNEGMRLFQIVAPVEPTQEEIEQRIQKQLTNAVQSVLDKKAQELLYDNCLSVCSYIDTGVPKFDDESRAFRKWRSAVWSKGYEILDLVKSGEMAIPSEEELIALLPELVIEYTEEA